MKEMAKINHSMAHKHANSVLFEPSDTGEIIWKFSTQQNWKLRVMYLVIMKLE